MAIFNSYIKLPEGRPIYKSLEIPLVIGLKYGNIDDTKSSFPYRKPWFFRGKIHENPSDSP
jgi:hypothetical protein